MCPLQFRYSVFVGLSVFRVCCYFQVQTPYSFIFIGVNQKTYANSVGMLEPVGVAHRLDIHLTMRKTECGDSQGLEHSNVTIRYIWLLKMFLYVIQLYVCCGANVYMVNVCMQYMKLQLRATASQNEVARVLQMLASTTIGLKTWYTKKYVLNNY